MGGRFCSLDQVHSQVRKYFSGNYVTSSPKLSEDQKKKKEKKYSPQFGTIFGRNLWDLFVLTGPFLSNFPSLKSRWGDAKSRWGDANFRLGDASPYNLRTDLYYATANTTVLQLMLSKHFTLIPAGTQFGSVAERV